MTTRRKIRNKEIELQYQIRSVTTTAKAQWM